MHQYVSKDKAQEEKANTTAVNKNSAQTETQMPVQKKSLFSFSGSHENSGEQMKGHKLPKSRPVQPNNTGIPTQMKERFESLSGFSFDDVRVHYNSGKPAQLQALAYTQGNQVYVAPGQEKHLGHELGHVVQQKRRLLQPTKLMNGIQINDNPVLEAQADILSHKPPEENAKITESDEHLNGIVQRVVWPANADDGALALAGPLPRPYFEWTGAGAQALYHTSGEAERNAMINANWDVGNGISVMVQEAGNRNAIGVYKYNSRTDNVPQNCPIAVKHTSDPTSKIRYYGYNRVIEALPRGERMYLVDAPPVESIVVHWHAAKTQEAIVIDDGIQPGYENTGAIPHYFIRPPIPPELLLLIDSSKGKKGEQIDKGSGGDERRGASLVKG